MSAPPATPIQQPNAQAPPQTPSSRKKKASTPLIVLPTPNMILRFDQEHEEALKKRVDEITTRTVEAAGERQNKPLQDLINVMDSEWKPLFNEMKIGDEQFDWQMKAFYISRNITLSNGEIATVVADWKTGFKQYQPRRYHEVKANVYNADGAFVNQRDMNLINYPMTSLKFSTISETLAIVAFKTANPDCPIDFTKTRNENYELYRELKKTGGDGDGEGEGGGSSDVDKKKLNAVKRLLKTTFEYDGDDLENIAEWLVDKLVDADDMKKLIEGKEGSVGKKNTELSVDLDDEDQAVKVADWVRELLCNPERLKKMMEMDDDDDDDNEQSAADMALKLVGQYGFEGQDATEVATWLGKVLDDEERLNIAMKAKKPRK